VAPENIHFPPLQSVIGSSEEGAGLKGQKHKGKYESKLEFPEGLGFKPKKPCMGRVWIFSGTIHFKSTNKITVGNVSPYSSGICRPNNPSSFNPSITFSGILASLSIWAESTMG